jgi:hypothetical protein
LLRCQLKRHHPKNNHQACYRLRVLVQIGKKLWGAISLTNCSTRN